MNKKRQIVTNRLIFLVIILLSSFNSFSQSNPISGEYYVYEELTDGHGSPHYIFSENNIFTVMSEDYYGKGHYSLEGRKLTLNYDLTELEFSSYHRYKRYHSCKDSIEIKLTIFGLDNNEPLENFPIVDYGSKLEKISRKDGVIFKFKKGKEKLDFFIGNMYMPFYHLELWTHSSYDVEVFMPRKFFIYNSSDNSLKGCINKLKIIKKTGKYLKVKYEDGYTQIWRKVEKTKE